MNCAGRSAALSLRGAEVRDLLEKRELEELHVSESGKRGAPARARARARALSLSCFRVAPHYYISFRSFL